MTTKKTDKICPLEEVLAYKNEKVIHKFLEKYKISIVEAENLFDELKKWLWLCAKTKIDKNKGIEAPRLFVSSSLFMLDEMWHTFILFTAEYIDFCQEKFGFIIHHYPTPKSEKEKMRLERKSNPEKFNAKLEEDFTKQIQYVYDKLGEATAVRWYSEYDDIYNEEFLNEARIPITL